MSMVIYDKPIPIKEYKQNLDDLDQFCRHHKDMEILINDWLPLEHVMYFKKKHGVTLKVQPLGFTLGIILGKIFDETAHRLRTKTNTANPGILNQMENRTLLAAQGFLGKHPLRSVLNAMFCLARFYSGTKNIDLY